MHGFIVEMLKVNEEENDVKRGKPKQMENCKSRLALLATEINQWEDDVASTKVKVSFIPLSM